MGLNTKNSINLEEDNDELLCKTDRRGQSRWKLNGDNEDDTAAVQNAIGAS